MSLHYMGECLDGYRNSEEWAITYVEKVEKTVDPNVT